MTWWHYKPLWLLNSNDYTKTSGLVGCLRKYIQLPPWWTKRTKYLQNSWAITFGTVTTQFLESAHIDRTSFNFHPKFLLLLSSLELPRSQRQLKGPSYPWSQEKLYLRRSNKKGCHTWSPKSLPRQLQLSSSSRPDLPRLPCQWWMVPLQGPGCFAWGLQTLAAYSIWNTWYD